MLVMQVGAVGDGVGGVDSVGGVVGDGVGGAVCLTAASASLSAMVQDKARNTAIQNPHAAEFSLILVTHSRM